jgi:hypothetical protein
MEEKELFENYEHKVWEFNPFIYKIIGASVLLHLVGFVTFSQFNLLETKACDSPYVGKFCQVLDAVYVANLVLGKDTDFVDEEYQRTELQDAEITYIDVSKMEPPFNYPDGYFAMANPEPVVDPLMPGSETFTPPTTNPLGTTPSQDNSLINKQPELPKPNNKVKDQDTPDSPFELGGPSGTPAVKAKNRQKAPKVNNSSPGVLPDLGNEVADGKKPGKKEPKPTPTPNEDQTAKNAPATAYEINKRPIEDLRDLVKAKLDANQVDLTAPFSITVDGVLGKNGKFDPNQTKVFPPTGDPQMGEVARRAIEAFNDSGYLQYLSELSDKRLVVKLQQDKSNIIVEVRSEVENETKARRIASGLNASVVAGLVFKKGKDEAKLLEQAKITSQGKVFMINFLIPQAVAQEMILRKLNEPSEKKTSQPNSSAMSQAANNKAE